MAMRKIFYAVAATVMLFALSAFGTAFGFVGMLVAVPVAAAIGVLTRFASDQYKASLLYRGLATDTLRDKGVALVRLFHTEAPRPHQVVGVEEPFSIEVCDPTTGEVFDERMVGAIDAITQDEDDQPYILEHKTGAKKRSFEGDLQGAAYSYVAPRIGLGESVSVTYQLLTKTKTPVLHIETVSFTAADQRDLLRTVAGVLAAVRAGAFYPRRDWQCRSCPFAGPCLAG